MIVTCPYCATRYNLEAARLAGPSPMLKCSRCRRVFPAPAEKKQAPAPSPPKSSAPDAANLTLPFDEPVWKDEPPPAPSGDLEIAEPEEQYTLDPDGTAEELVVPTDGAPESEATPFKGARPATRRTAAPQTAAPAARASIEEDTEEDSGAPMAEDAEDEVEVDTDDRDAGDTAARRPAPRRPASRRAAARGVAPRDSERGRVWALMIFLAAVLASYGMLTRALFANPQLCDRLLSRVPLIGLLGGDRLLTRKVALSEVAGSYQRIKDGKQVFIITGKAVNTAPVALHDVQIAGKLFNNEGHELDEKVIFCGNVISTKVLKDLTPREVSILQKLSPPKRFTIEPGESSTFVIVFMDPPHQAVEFSTQVAAAQHHA